MIGTSTFTHFCRAGHSHVISALAPKAVVLVPREVEIEIDNARERYIGVPLLHQVPGASRILMTENEEWTATRVKAVLGGDSEEHLGESAVIACARHRGLVTDEPDLFGYPRSRLALISDGRFSRSVHSATRMPGLCSPRMGSPILHMNKPLLSRPRMPVPRPRTWLPSVATYDGFGS